MIIVEHILLTYLNKRMQGNLRRFAQSFCHARQSIYCQPLQRFDRQPVIASQTVRKMTDGAGAQTYKYVIIGAGNAAGYAARQYVSLEGPVNSLCIVGEEPALPYERPALSKAVLTNPKVRLPGFNTCVGGGGDRQTADWYAEKGIQTITSGKVTSVDTSSKSAKLEDGKTVTATDAMIVATGAVPIHLTRTPGHDLSGISYLRNNADALKLYDELQAHIGKKVAIIGGGYIGMEVAAAAVIVGCEVTMIFPEAHMMSRLFTAEIAQPYEDFYKGKGVTFVNDGALGKAFLPDDSGTAVRGVLVGREGQPDEEVPASLVIVGVGARPETNLLKGQVDTDERGGVLVNGSLETSAKGVYAIGDIASFPLKLYNDRVARMEHVQNARDMATHVMNAVVSGDKSAYDYLPYFYSRVFNLSWQFFGDNAGLCSVVSEFDGQALLDWTEAKGKHPQMIAIWTNADSVLQGVFMESPTADDTANMKRVARERPTVDVEKFNGCETVTEAWKELV